MTRKTHSLIAAACLGVLGMVGQASACQFTMWGSGLAAGQGTVTTAAGQLVAGQPDGANGTTPGVNVARYSGRCGSLARDDGNYTQDGSPGQEQAYIVRFYFFTGISGGTATVFRALSNTAATTISVTYDATAGTLAFTAGATATATGIQQGRWYSVEMNWANGGQMTTTLQGAGSATPIAVANVAAGSGNVETVQLGWISGTGTTGANRPGIIADAFESRRATAIGRLKRSDANNDNACDANDITRIATEVLGNLIGTPSLSLGQPDGNEDGSIDANDITASATIIIGDLLGGTSCGV